MTEYTKDQIKRIKFIYSSLSAVSPSERDLLMQEVQAIREKVEGKQLFSDDIGKQADLARHLGLKYPDKK